MPRNIVHGSRLPCAALSMTAAPTGLPMATTTTTPADPASVPRLCIAQQPRRPPPCPPRRPPPQSPRRPPRRAPPRPPPQPPPWRPPPQPPINGALMAAAIIASPLAGAPMATSAATLAGASARTSTRDSTATVPVRSNGNFHGRINGKCRCCFHATVAGTSPSATGGHSSRSKAVDSLRINGSGQPQRRPRQRPCRLPTQRLLRQQSRPHMWHGHGHTHVSCMAENRGRHVSRRQKATAPDPLLPGSRVCVCSNVPIRRLRIRVRCGIPRGRLVRRRQQRRHPPWPSHGLVHGGVPRSSPRAPNRGH